MRHLALLPVLFCPLIQASTPASDPEDSAVIGAAQRGVAKYHSGEADSGAVLRVVYFHPSDRDPLPNYADRLDRVLNDVSEFYRDGLRRFGVESNGLPLEKKDGRLVLHVVKGKLPASEYQHESGNQTVAEIRAALKGTLDLDREHVLIMYGLCRKEPDGRYVFDAPYYGSGSARGGICHAADCELLDPALLKETGKNIVYTEHYYPRMEQTVAKFNSMYLGGTAHELGHGLGLPHDAGNPVEKAFGTSLMGSGNLTYRQETWGGGEPVILTRASALQLLSHPLITRSNRGRWEEVDATIDALSFTAEGQDIWLNGTVSGKVPPYGVVAYVLPVSHRTDHRARTYSALLDGGNFAMTISGLKPDEYRIKLATLHANGATTVRDYSLGFTNGKPDVAALNDASYVKRFENAVMKGNAKARAMLSDEAIAAAPTPEGQRRMRILRAVLEPAPIVDLGKSETDSVYLSDANWTEASVGWGQIARNHYWFDKRIRQGVFLSLRGQIYGKGLYAHSPSRYVFPVDGKWKTVEAVIGLRDGALSQGSAVFTVRGDGKELYRSPILRARSREEVKVDIAGVKQLELVAEGGEGHNHNSWAIWAEPKVSR